MMRIQKHLSLLRAVWAAAILCLIALCLGASAPPNPARRSPKLVLVLVIDQFREDYLSRYRDEYTGGFARLLRGGAVFNNAYLQHFPTVTAVGHSTLLTGALPALSGIVGNDWYEEDAGRVVTSVSDLEVKLLGAPNGAGASPRRLLVSTVGDELKMAAKGPSKVIGISYKDRAAILPSGRMADAAYWFDSPTGNIVSSTYYFPDLPAWVKEFNTQRPADRYLGMEWKTHDGKSVKRLPKETGLKYYVDMEGSPFGTDFQLAFVQRAIEAEQLGSRGATDVLSVSLSSTDVVGHTYGPDSAEIHDMHVHTDRSLGQLFQYLDKRLGLSNVIVVLSADHGVAPDPDLQAKRKMPGGRMTEAVPNAVIDALTASYGEGTWVLFTSSGSFWLNHALIRQKHLKEAEVEQCAADALARVPHVYRVYTATQLLLGQVGENPVGRRVANSYFRERSADVISTLEPYWMFDPTGTTHGSAYSYDSHVPFILMGPGIKPGMYDQTVAMNDLAPTLTVLLTIETPSGSTGRALTEVLEQH